MLFPVRGVDDLGNHHTVAQLLDQLQTVLGRPGSLWEIGGDIELSQPIQVKAILVGNHLHELPLLEDTSTMPRLVMPQRLQIAGNNMWRVDKVENVNDRDFVKRFAINSDCQMIFMSTNLQL